MRRHLCTYNVSWRCYCCHYDVLFLAAMRPPVGSPHPASLTSACPPSWAPASSAPPSPRQVWSWSVCLPDFYENLSSCCRQISTTVSSADVPTLRVWVLWHTLCFVLWPSAVRTGLLLPLASHRVSRAGLLLLCKRRRGLRGEGNSLGICPASSGTYRNNPRSPRSHSGKNNWRNVRSWNTVKSSTSRGKCYSTIT